MRGRRRVLAVAAFSCLLQPVVQAADDAEPRASASALAVPLATAGMAAATLDASDAVIGDIHIVNDNVFDTSLPDEDGILYRAANAMHSRTRPEVIRQQLLFDSGQAYSSRLLEESERILRSDPYLQEVQLAPLRHADGKVDVLVRTRDAWTLRPALSLHRSGGHNSGGLGVDELNLFGSGIRVGARYRSNVDRDSLSFQYLDRNVGNSWTEFQALYATNSDGFNRLLRVERPFFALDSHFAAGFALRQDERVDAFYDHGDAISHYGGDSLAMEAYTGWSRGIRDGWTRRYRVGLAFEDDGFQAVPGEPNAITPGNRRLAYPFFGIEFIQDEFEEARNLDQIHRVEDRNPGTTISARIGLASSSLGSDRNALLLQASASRGFGNVDATSLMLTADLRSRVETGAVRDLQLALSARYFRRQSDKSLLYARLSAIYGEETDLDRLLPLGGDSGLRGYPLRYRMGESRALLTVEQRYFTDWYPFHLFHVGAAVFADIGRSFGNSPVGGENPGWLRDVGFGLRLGNTRSALGRVVHIDLAYPLDGDRSLSNVQFVIGTRRSF